MGVKFSPLRLLIYLELHLQDDQTLKMFTNF